VGALQTVCGTQSPFEQHSSTAAQRAARRDNWRARKSKEQSASVFWPLFSQALLTSLFPPLSGFSFPNLFQPDGQQSAAQWEEHQAEKQPSCQEEKHRKQSKRIALGSKQCSLEMHSEHWRVQVPPPTNSGQVFASRTLAQLLLLGFCSARPELQTVQTENCANCTN